MPQYLIYFNQQWVGDHDEAWFESRVKPSTAVVRDMQDQGVLVYAGGLVEELEEAASADATSGELVVTDGPFVETKEWLGGLTIVDVPDDEAARMWAGRVAEGCGWPQEVRRFKAGSLQAPSGELLTICRGTGIFAPVVFAGGASRYVVLGRPGVTQTPAWEPQDTTRPFVLDGF